MALIAFGLSTPLRVTDGLGAFWATANFDGFDILGQGTDNTFLINAGTAYDALGQRLYLSERIAVQLDFPSDYFTEGGIRYGYLCIRRKECRSFIDYREHPETGLRWSSKKLIDVQFYLARAVATLGTGLHFAPLSNSIIDGVVLGKVYENAAKCPDATYKTYISVKNGAEFTVPGFTGI